MKMTGDHVAMVGRIAPAWNRAPFDTTLACQGSRNPLAFDRRDLPPKFYFALLSVP